MGKHACLQEGAPCSYLTERVPQRQELGADHLVQGHDLAQARLQVAEGNESQGQKRRPDREESNEAKLDLHNNSVIIGVL